MKSIRHTNKLLCSRRTLRSAAALVIAPAFAVNVALAGDPVGHVDIPEINTTHDPGQGGEKWYGSGPTTAPFTSGIDTFDRPTLTSLGLGQGDSNPLDLLFGEPTLDPTIFSAPPEEMRIRPTGSFGGGSTGASLDGYASVPTPGAGALLALGLAFGASRRRRR